MRDNIRKNSYHMFCRRNQQINSMPHMERPRQIKTSQTKNRNNQLEQFDDFKTYLQYIESKQRQRRSQHYQRPLANSRREVLTARPTVYYPNRQDNQCSTSKQEMVKPFFPFFKCRIESVSSGNRQSNFRISQHRLKLNYRIIQQNMGKVQRQNNPY